MVSSASSQNGKSIAIRAKLLLIAVLCMSGAPSSFAFRVVTPIATPTKYPKFTKASVRTCDTTRYASAVLQMSEQSEDVGKRSLARDLRSRLRQLTGFSLTAFRASMRALTGISLTALYVSALAATSKGVRIAMTWVLAPLPAWFRYFLQPLLVLYYAPLFILRNWTGPTRKRALETHQSVLEGWRDAVSAAKSASKDGYWPVQVAEDGSIVAVSPSDPGNERNNMDVQTGIAKSVEVAMDQKLND